MEKSFGHLLINVFTFIWNEPVSNHHAYSVGICGIVVTIIPPYNVQTLYVRTKIHFFTFSHAHICYPISVVGKQTYTHHWLTPCPMC